MKWEMKELSLFCDIQTVAAITGLPIVISALKHLSKHEQEIAKSTILENVEQDEDLKKAGYKINSGKTIDDAIESLITVGFLSEDEKDNDLIILTKKGLKAIAILKLNKD